MKTSLRLYRLHIKVFFSTAGGNPKKFLNDYFLSALFVFLVWLTLHEFPHISRMKKHPPFSDRFGFPVPVYCIYRMLFVNRLRDAFFFNVPCNEKYVHLTIKNRFVFDHVNNRVPL